MKFNNILFLGAMFGAATLASASSTFTFNSLGYASPNLTNGITGSGGAYLGPYTGTLNGQTVPLYCDDYANHVSPGNSYNVNVTLVSAIMANPSAYTNTVRFAATTSQDGIALPTGTNIYQEIAWLLTQETKYQQPAGAANQTGTIQDAIQDAIWDLTENGTPTNSNFSTSVNVSGTTVTGAGASTLNPYLWATLAANATNLNASSNSTITVAGTSVTLYAANYSTWAVIDQSTGFIGGASGIGVNGQYQELLTQISAAPEPGTFALLGGVLAAGFAIRKRRKA